MTGYSFIKDDDDENEIPSMELYHVEHCTLIKCAANVKVIKDILALLPNYSSSSSSSSSSASLFANIFNMESQDELTTLIQTEKSQKAIVMTIMERLTGEKKKMKWRPGRIKQQDLDILHQKEVEGRNNTTNKNATNTTSSWELCQPCQPLDDELPITLPSESVLVNLPQGISGSELVSTHGKLTRREYLETKKNNQTQWFVERIRSFRDKDKEPLTILDVGGGRGDLAVHLALDFPNAQLIVVDCNESSIAAGKRYATTCSVEDRIKFVFQNFSEYHAEYSVQDGKKCKVIDVVVALHACGDLSDMALQFANQNQCDFVICPCCYPKRYLTPFKPFWHSFCNEDEVDSLSRMVELDNESRNDESRRAMLVINSMRRRAFDEGCVKVEEFSNKFSKRNIVLVRDSFV